MHGVSPKNRRQFRNNHYMKLNKLSAIPALFCFTLFIDLFSPLYSQAQPVKGVWVTNVLSNALDSRENIRETVRLCSETGINNIYVVTWNSARTIYPSKIMKERFGVPIMERFSGRDPLKEIIYEAHKRNIKVHAWFEFGFSCSYKESNGGIIIRRHPGWAAIDSKGNLVTKNGFQWMNAFNPEVQAFITSLITEVVLKYNVDGIQGDDRLPAVPSESGYDSYTMNLYKAQHNGALPPAESKDPEWVQWRADLLTNYLESLCRHLRSIRPGIIISMAPGIHPWAKEQYLQDWPLWLKNGYIDYVMPQVYRANFKDYQATLATQIRVLKEGDKNRFFPGVLLKADGKVFPSAGLLDSIITENRRNGVMGECFFYFEGLKDFSDFFKKYSNK